MKIPTGLIGGPLNGRALLIESNTLWLFISVLDDAMNQTIIAQWPHEDPPTKLPKIPRPLLCYRYKTNDPRMLFGYEKSLSDSLDGEATEAQVAGA